jgi:plastocyanin
MHLVRRSTVVVLAVAMLALVLATGATAKPAAGPHTYTVLVGAESVHRGVDVMAYFPDKLTINVGDTVHWVQNSNEIHTVTFLGATPLPDLIVPAASLGLPATPSPLVFNPAAVLPTGPTTLGDTSTYVSSGLMGREQGQARSFDLTFTAPGTYQYVCIVHGTMMSGTVSVIAVGAHVMSPERQLALGRAQIARQFAKAPAVIREAVRQEQPPTKNADGTLTHSVLIGFSKDQIDLMRFFPSVVRVRPGDKVSWTLSASNRAPHTVSFLNGQDEPGLIVAVPQASGPAALYLNPAVLFPSQPAALLARAGIYNSGLIQPGTTTPYTLQVGAVTPGPLPYLCLLHDTSGMKGTLIVQSR